MDAIILQEHALRSTVCIIYRCSSSNTPEPASLDLAAAKPQVSLSFARIKTDMSVPMCLILAHLLLVGTTRYFLIQM